MMLKYTRMASVTGDASMDIFTPSAMGVAMGNVPGWAVLMDPAYTKGNTILNRCSGTDMLNTGTSPTTPEIVDSGGNKFMHFPDGRQPNIRSIEPLDPRKLTVFGVVKLAVKSTANRQTLITSMTATEPIPQLNVSFYGDGTRLLVSTRGNTNANSEALVPRVQYIPNVSYLGRLAYVMMTFSDINGLVLYENGVEVARNSDDRRPFVDSTDPDKYSFLRGVCGDVGLVGVINNDLSLPAFTQHKAAVDNFILNKYVL